MKESPEDRLDREGTKTESGRGGERLVFKSTNPIPTARAFVDHHYTHSRVRTLHHHAGVFYRWENPCYREVDARTIRSELYAFLETAWRRDGRTGKPVPFEPNAVRVSNVVDAMHAITHLEAMIQPPVWLNGSPRDAPPASEIMAFSNGLLHVPSGVLLQPSPSFFSLNGVDYPYDPQAPEPHQWLSFLNSLWPQDRESIETRQMILGYGLMPKGKHQKIFAIVGPTRSGKGTIAYVFTKLLGEANVCSPSPSSLGGNFGLAPLIGKQLAIIPDARLSGRADQQVIVERLLTISGEDKLVIDRKHRDAWHGRLDTKIFLMTNLLPNLSEASGALIGRLIVLRLQEGFLDREDLSLKERLLPELPGIMTHFAIPGYHMLCQRGRFQQPASSEELIRRFSDLASPIKAFIRDYGEVATGQMIQCSRLFTHWLVWCEDNHRDHPGTVQTFGRDLVAVVPALGENRLTIEGQRVWCYEGIGLRPDLPLGVKVRAEARLEVKWKTKQREAADG
jgi:putative DNA primase/helicase